MESKETGKTRITRRGFAAGTLALAPLIVPRRVLGGPGYQAPSDQLTIAAVGIAGMGRNYLDGCKAEKIVALCELDWTRTNTGNVFKAFPTANRYRDFRQMFDKEAKNFDALIIAVPDHWHHHLLPSHAARTRTDADRPSLSHGCDMTRSSWREGGRQGDRALPYEGKP